MMKCPKCQSEKTKKVSVLDEHWQSGAQRCLECGHQGNWGDFCDPPLPRLSVRGDDIPLRRMKRTASELADQILWEGYERFIPPVPRYREPEPQASDWKTEYDRLLEHHTAETDALLSIIRELARRLSPA